MGQVGPAVTLHGVLTAAWRGSLFPRMQERMQERKSLGPGLSHCPVAIPQIVRYSLFRRYSLFPRYSLFLRCYNMFPNSQTAQNRADTVYSSWS